MRLSLERSIGKMLLVHWSGKVVGDPVDYFRTEMKGQPEHPSQHVVEQILAKSFESGFSKTIEGRDFAGVQKLVSKELANSLKAEGLVRPTTLGFRDLLFHIETSSPLRQGIPLELTDGDRKSVV